jgi:queuine tRNA-ribosyltransferase
MKLLPRVPGFNAADHQTQSILAHLREQKRLEKPVFRVLRQSKTSMARAGELTTATGRLIRTPTFVPVATHAAIKGPTMAQGEQLAELLFCNTYHLEVHPGAATVAQAGGVHGFSGRTRGAFISDSGGFQAFSLRYGSVEDDLKRGNVKAGRAGTVGRVREEGVRFTSYMDGRKIDLTPESSVRLQKLIGADIILPLDELLPNRVSERDHLFGFQRTHRWMMRSLVEHLKDAKDQLMYGIVHGGTDHEFRAISAAFLASLPFDGFAIGGSLGATRAEVGPTVAATVAALDAAGAGHKPRHVLGIGDPATLTEVVLRGADSADSSYPTKLARHGQVFTAAGDGPTVQLDRTAYLSDHTPIDPECDCSTCAAHTKSYLHHLIKTNETSTSMNLLCVHNLTQLKNKMANLREQILQGKI